MREPIKNPICYTFLGIASVLLLAGILLGVQISQSLQLIFIPYTYDITRGVGRSGAAIYSGVLAVAQISLLVLAIIGSESQSTIKRRFVWGVGILLVVIYYVFMLLGYLANNLH